ncbi:glycosyltransferase [Patescibacteria group bacterium]|nr:glycosyltransferase [Patescibacteria group bacterium]
MKKVSLIVTILNEEKTIISLLDSIVQQVIKPDEVVIVDGGSKDKTVELINDFIKELGKQNSELSFKLYIKKGNRSVGRNFAIEKSKYPLIAVTDAGCVLDKNWLKELIKKQKQLSIATKKDAEVVAGYYSALPKTPFEEAVVPYVLVMPDQVDENNFLPATRSVLFSKNIWQKVGGFDEKLSDNEDYNFARRLKSSGTKIGFSKNAIVFWKPSSNLKSFYKMIFRFARGDTYAGIIRPKVLLIFARYLLGLSVFIWGILQLKFVGNLWILFGVVPTFLVTYILWSIYKNYRYAQCSWYWLPVLQISSDIMVVWGSVWGLVKK